MATYGYLFYGKMRVTQTYGNSGHTGMDIVGDDDPTVHCCVAGTVETVHTWDGKTTSQSSIESYGNFVVVKTSDGMRFYYAHLKSMAVKEGQSVSVGTTIGVMGSTGNSTGAHTHFEARTGSSTSTRTNPAKYCCLENVCGTYYSTNTEVSGYTYYTVVSGNKSLNYRSKASTSGTVKGTLANGSQVLVKDAYCTTANGYTWFKIQVGGVDYYAASKWLQLILDEDGAWGKLTTLRLQDVLGCTARDKEVSNQYKMYKDSNPGCTGGWDWSLADNDKGTKYSIVFKAFQKHIGMPTSEQDGHAGPISFTAAQNYFGTKADGYLSNPSDMVKALQKALNAGTF